MRRSGTPVGVTRNSPGGRVSAATFSEPNSFGFDCRAGVPGLGFDYTDLAAICGAVNNPNNGSFGFRHRQNFGGESFFPIVWWGGYPSYYDESGYDQPAPQTQQQPQVIVIQQPVPAQQNAESESDSRDSGASASAPQATEPVTDVGEFVLVRKDGRVLFASIYQVVGAQIQYITPEGIRRSVPLSELDADATLQMNEARGATVDIHN